TGGNALLQRHHSVLRPHHHVPVLRRDGPDLRMPRRRRRSEDGGPVPLRPTPRSTCARCRRPAAFCWCRLIEPATTRTRIVFLQHPRESRTRIGTARMAHLALTSSELHVGTSLPGPPGPRTAVLFPGPGAAPPAILAEGEPWTLV